MSSFEEVVAFVALAWLIGSVLLMARSVRRGRELVAALERRHPNAYEAMGRPRPSLLPSARRHQFAQFLARRRYEELSDPPLAAEFESHRRAEARLVVGVLAAMVVVCLLVFLARWADSHAPASSASAPEVPALAVLACPLGRARVACVARAARRRRSGT